MTAKGKETAENQCESLTLQLNDAQIEIVRLQRELADANLHYQVRALKKK